MARLNEDFYRAVNNTETLVVNPSNYSPLYNDYVTWVKNTYGAMAGNVDVVLINKYLQDGKLYIENILRLPFNEDEECFKTGLFLYTYNKATIKPIYRPGEQVSANAHEVACYTYFKEFIKA